MYTTTRLMENEQVARIKANLVGYCSLCPEGVVWYGTSCERGQTRLQGSSWKLHPACLVAITEGGARRCFRGTETSESPAIDAILRSALVCAHAAGATGITFRCPIPQMRPLQESHLRLMSARI